MTPRNPGQGRVQTSEKERTDAHPPQGDSTDTTSTRRNRRRFLAHAATTVIALAVPPLFPSPAQDLVERWTQEELGNLPAASP
jgi:hypothetical protein